MGECFISPDKQQRKGQLEKQYRHLLFTQVQANGQIVTDKNRHVPVLQNGKSTTRTAKHESLHRCKSAVMHKQAQEKKKNREGTGFSE